MLITDIHVHDIRFPTSDLLDGSDSMHVDPDYSATYVTLSTDGEMEGNGLTFTCGRGNEVCVAAARAYSPLVIGRSLADLTDDFGSTWNAMANESQLRWIGPQKGASHMALAAIVNAIWDLWAKSEGKPLWKLLVDMSPEDIVRCIDFSWISDALTPGESIDMLQSLASTRDQRETELRTDGYPAYTTSAGWLGYTDERIRTLCAEGMAAGWNHFKIKVGRDPVDDHRRCAIVREMIGPDRKLMIDANQCWDVEEAIESVRALAEFDPWWIEEPTCPDDVLGHARIAREVAPIGVATGEACQNRVIFKQFLQAEAISFCQLDACRLGGLNEVLAVMLLAARYGIPVCPHAGGVGLCEYVSHLVQVDYICISGTRDDRIAEYVDHLHEHFEVPCRVQDGQYLQPTEPGYGCTIKQSSIDAFTFPTGSAWKDRSRIDQAGERSRP